MRHARATDLPAIVAIYNAAIPSRQATADTEPVSIESKTAWFEAHAPECYPLLVHEIEGQVVAWVGLQSFHGRPAYKHTAEISFYIDPGQQGKGLGHLLLNAAIEAARKIDLKTLIAYVFSHNTPSLTLLARHGFEEWGKLPNVTEMDRQEYSVSILGKRIAP
jgi:phosphinothricin acetyltransferase